MTHSASYSLDKTILVHKMTWMFSKRQMLTKIKIKSANTQGEGGGERTEERHQWHESRLCVIWDAP